MYLYNLTSLLQLATKGRNSYQNYYEKGNNTTMSDKTQVNPGRGTGTGRIQTGYYGAR